MSQQGETVGPKVIRSLTEPLVQEAPVASHEASNEGLSLQKQPRGKTFASDELPRIPFRATSVIFPHSHISWRSVVAAPDHLLGTYPALYA